MQHKWLHVQINRRLNNNPQEKRTQIIINKNFYVTIKIKFQDLKTWVLTKMSAWLKFPKSIILKAGKIIWKNWLCICFEDVHLGKFFEEVHLEDYSCKGKCEKIVLHVQIIKIFKNISEEKTFFSKDRMPTNGY